jgi:hypothetical protein
MWFWWMRRFRAPIPELPGIRRRQKITQCRIYLAATRVPTEGDIVYSPYGIKWKENRLTQSPDNAPMESAWLLINDGASFNQIKLLRIKPMDPD